MRRQSFDPIDVDRVSISRFVGLDFNRLSWHGPHPWDLDVVAALMALPQTCPLILVVYVVTRPWTRILALIVPCGSFLALRNFGHVPFRFDHGLPLVRNQAPVVSIPPNGVFAEDRCQALAITIEPMTIKIPPTQWRQDRCSPRNRAASTIATTTLNLSIGATLDAWPSCSARK